MLIDVKQMELTYEVRTIDPGRSWFRHLFKPQYVRHPVLKNLSIAANTSGITAILGKNGVGKTTLMKILSGILTPTAGQVRVLGYEPHRRQAEFLRQIGAVFGQKKMLWPELSLRENFAVTAAIYRVDVAVSRTRTDLLISLFRLANYLDRPVKSLSLGESMKAELANILLYEPKILFLDEPTIGLDVPSQIAVREIIKNYIKDHECHILLTSHNTRDVASLADKVLFLENGQLIDFQSCANSTVAFEAELEQKFMTL